MTKTIKRDLFEERKSAFQQIIEGQTSDALKDYINPYKEFMSLTSPLQQAINDFLKPSREISEALKAFTAQSPFQKALDEINLPAQKISEALQAINGVTSQIRAAFEPYHDVMKL